MKNVRDTIKAINFHNKGELAMSQTKTQSYEVIKDAFYSGEKQVCRFNM